MQARIFFYLLSCLFLFTCTSKKEKDKKYKIFRYNQAEGLSSLDPAFARNQANVWAISQLFNGLVELDDRLNVKPCIAESWTISNDGTEYIFKIKKGIRFHDHEAFKEGKGREVKAHDFVYSFKRIIDTKIASTGAWIFNDKLIVNKLNKIADSAFLAVDDYTLKIHLKQPFPPFLQILAMPYAFVVPEEVVEMYGKDFRSHPVGTGAFKFKVWEESSTLIFVKNPSYWKIDSNGIPLPHLDAVQISFISDKNIAFITFRQKKLDFLSGVDENSREMILDHHGNVRKEFSHLFKIQKLLYLNTEYIGFQMDPKLYDNPKHPLLDKKVRKALNYAIDRKELIAYFRNNLGQPGISGITPCPLKSFDTKKVIGYEFNPKKSAELLKEAGYPGGKGIPELVLYTNAPYKQIAEYLQKEFSKIGVKLRIEINQFSTHQELVDNGKVNMFRASWLGDYPDSENFMSLFYSKNFSPTGPNKTHFKKHKFDKLYEESQLVDDLDERNAIYKEMEKVMLEEAPVIILYYDELIRLTQNNVIGMDANPMNTINLENVDFIENFKKN